MKSLIFALSLFCLILPASQSQAIQTTDAGTLYRHCTAAFKLQQLRSQMNQIEPQYIHRLNQSALKCSITLSVMLESVYYFNQEAKKICLPSNYTSSKLAQLMVTEIKENAHLLPLPQMQVIHQTLLEKYPCAGTSESDNNTLDSE